jgi:hypothetical protein
VSVPPSPSKGSMPGPLSSVSSSARCSRSLAMSLTPSFYADRHPDRNPGGSALFLDAAVRLPDHDRCTLVLTSDLCGILHGRSFGLALRNDLAALLLHLPAGLGGSLLHGVDLPFAMTAPLSLREESCPSSREAKRMDGYPRRAPVTSCNANPDARSGFEWDREPHFRARLSFDSRPPCSPRSSAVFSAMVPGYLGKRKSGSLLPAVMGLPGRSPMRFVRELLTL